MDTRLQQLAKTDRNPIQETEYQTLLKQQGAQTTPSSGASTASFDPVALAKQFISTTQEANKPAIGTLQGIQTDLKQRYSDLVDSIKGAGTVAANKQTTITANELGNRGILPNTTYGQQEIQNALLPINAAYAGQAANTGLAGEQSQADIASQIASLQAGNPAGALTIAGNIVGQSLYPNAVVQSAQLQNLYKEIPSMGGLFNTAKGQLINQLNGGGNSSTGGIQIVNGIPYINVP